MKRIIALIVAVVCISLSFSALATTEKWMDEKNKAVIFEHMRGELETFLSSYPSFYKPSSLYRVNIVNGTVECMTRTNLVFNDDGTVSLNKYWTPARNTRKGRTSTERMAKDRSREYSIIDPYVIDDQPVYWAVDDSGRLVLYSLGSGTVFFKFEINPFGDYKYINLTDQLTGQMENFYNKHYKKR